ncbi:TadE/TadG family type IV pilus assembly protein [Microbaculum sp. FT89]|uniref:TadE/TadG family type IV pilus assembly protein n=1 Tax=Microbaculum sp. FT89 TaxID=3447298 RepID=UPI003F539895
MSSSASTSPAAKRGVARRLTSLFLRDRRGVAAIEFAFVFPLLIMVVGASIEYGRALQARNEMSHALSKVVRVLNIDPKKSSSQIASLLAADLSTYGPDDLQVAVANAQISGSPYMKISVKFPFDLLVPFGELSTVTLGVDTVAPLIAATK